MDDKLNFTEKDVDELIEFLNLTAKEVEFKKGFDIPKCIDYFKALSYIQTIIIPKMKSNILEVKEYIKHKDELPEIPESE